MHEQDNPLSPMEEFIREKLPEATDIEIAEIIKIIDEAIEAVLTKKGMLA